MGLIKENGWVGGLDGGYWYRTKMIPSSNKLG